MLELYTLGADALIYMREELSRGFTFARKLGRLLEDREGSITSYLPHGIGDVALHNFHIDIASGPDGNTNQEIRDRIEILIAEYLGQRTHRRYAIVETLGEQGDRVVEREGWQHFLYDTDVYFYVSGGDPLRPKIRQALAAARDYPFVAGLTSLPDSSRSIRSRIALPSKTLDQLVVRTQIVLVGAYDACGFLIWTRHP